MTTKALDATLSPEELERRPTGEWEPVTFFGLPCPPYRADEPLPPERSGVIEVDSTRDERTPVRRRP